MDGFFFDQGVQVEKLSVGEKDLPCLSPCIGTSHKDALVYWIYYYSLFVAVKEETNTLNI